MKDKEIYNLIKDEFKKRGYPNENPKDLQLLTSILQLWLDPNIDDSKYNYSPQEYALLNDPECYQILSYLYEYYQPKKSLTGTQIKQILESISQGTLTSTQYDFKNSQYITTTPSFSERLKALDLLVKLNSAQSQDLEPAIQFINNITTPSPIQPPSIQPPSITPPDAPPANHFSLSSATTDDITTSIQSPIQSPTQSPNDEVVTDI